MKVRRFLAGTGVAVLTLVVGAAPAFADRLAIREVDTTQFPKVRISTMVSGQTPTPGSFNVRENGTLQHRLDVKPISETGKPLGIVLAIDTSAAMKARNRLELTKAAAKQFIADRPAGSKVAVVAFSDRATLLADFTDDVAALDGAIDRLEARGNTFLWDGIRRAAAVFADNTLLQPNLVVVSHGADQGSTATADAARAGVLDAKAPMFVVGLTGETFAEGQLRSIVDDTDGEMFTTPEADGLNTQFALLRRSLHDNQYEISYTSAATTPTVDLEVSTGELRSEARAVSIGTLSHGHQAQPEVVKPRTVGPLSGPFGRLVASLFVLGVVGLVAFLFWPSLTGSGSGLASALRPYAEQLPAGEDDEAGGYAETAFVQRAVGITAKLADDRGLLVRLEAKLEQADVPLRAAEALFFHLAGTAIAAVLALVVWGFFGGIAVLAIVALAPLGVLNFLSARRKRKFTSQLPDTLQLLAGSLRAGYSLMQGVEAVAQEVADPMGHELNRVMAEARLGRPLEDALQDCADRMGSPDFDWAVMAIRIQREVGGNLAELLSTVGETMIHRERLRREIKALTAEGRMSAMVLGFLPAGLGLIMYVLNPEYIRVLFTDGMGQMMTIGAAVLAGFGFWWMKKTIEIEV